MLDIPHIDFMAIAAAYNGEPYWALMPVIATAGQVAAGTMSVGLGPSSTIKLCSASLNPRGYRLKTIWYAICPDAFPIDYKVPMA